MRACRSRKEIINSIACTVGRGRGRRKYNDALFETFLSHGGKAGGTGSRGPREFHRAHSFRSVTSRTRHGIAARAFLYTLYGCDILNRARAFPWSCARIGTPPSSTRLDSSMQVRRRGSRRPRPRPRPRRRRHGRRLRNNAPDTKGSGSISAARVAT